MKNYLFLFILIFSICIVSVTTSTAFFSHKNSLTGNITLGELDFNVYTNAIEPQIIMPGDTSNFSVYLVNARDIDAKNIANLSPLYFRFNVKILSKNENVSHNLILHNPQDFIQINDTYYYLKPLNPADRIVILDALQFSPHITNSVARQPIEITITADAIQANLDAIAQIWPEFYNYL